MTKSHVKVVRVYDDPGREPDEYRVLVDRLWPRAMAKSQVDMDEWLRDVAPSHELRKWYAHDPARFVEFTSHYHDELALAPSAALVERLRAHRRHLILLTATKDIEHSSAKVLREFLITPPGA